MLDVERHLVVDCGRQCQIEDAIRIKPILDRLHVLVERLVALGVIVWSGNIVIQAPEFIIFHLFMRLHLSRAKKWISIKLRTA